MLTSKHLYLCKLKIGLTLKRIYGTEKLSREKKKSGTCSGMRASDHRTQSHLEDVAGAFAADVVLAGQDDHGFGEQLQADRADQLLLQVLHGGSSAGAGPRTACWWRLVAEGKVHYPPGSGKVRSQRRITSRETQSSAGGFLAISFWIQYPLVYVHLSWHFLTLLFFSRIFSPSSVRARTKSLPPAVHPFTPVPACLTPCKDPPMLLSQPSQQPDCWPSIFLAPSVCSGLGYCLNCVPRPGPLEKSRHHDSGQHWGGNVFIKSDTLEGILGGIMQPLAAMFKVVSTWA